MGILDATTEALKKHCPDITPVTNACRTTYNLGGSAINAVKENGVKTTVNVTTGAINKLSSAVTAVKENGAEKVKGYIPGPETQDKILWYAKHPGTREVAKLFIPVPVCNVVGAALKGNSAAYPNQNDKKSDQLMEQMKILQADYKKLWTELELVKMSDSPNPVSSPICHVSGIAQKPEEVISIFMMKGLKVTDFVNNQVVPIRGQFKIEP